MCCSLKIDWLLDSGRLFDTGRNKVSRLLRKVRVCLYNRNKNRDEVRIEREA